MTKTQKAIEQLNKTQTKAIKFIGLDKPRGVSKRTEAKKGWYLTGANCRKDTATVLETLGLAKCGELNGKTIVKPTAMGKRVAAAL